MKKITIIGLILIIGSFLSAEPNPNAIRTTIDSFDEFIRRIERSYRNGSTNRNNVIVALNLRLESNLTKQELNAIRKKLSYIKEYYNGMKLVLNGSNTDLLREAYYSNLLELRDVQRFDDAYLIHEELEKSLIEDIERISIVDDRIDKKLKEL